MDIGRQCQAGRIDAERRTDDPQIAYGGMPVVVDALEVFKAVLVERGEWEE